MSFFFKPSFDEEGSYHRRICFCEIGVEVARKIKFLKYREYREKTQPAIFVLKIRMYPKKNPLSAALSKLP